MKYYIPRFKLSKLKTLVNRLSKKTEVKFDYNENDIKQESIIIDNKRYFYNTIGIELEIDYKVGDYDIVAELEHHQEGNIIRQINYNYSVDSKYRTAKPYCEHCNKLRNRNNTFLLIDKTGNTKQVGKSCLKDFIGYDNEKIIELVSRINLCMTDYDEEEVINYSKECRFQELKNIANKFYQLILKNGYNKENPFKDFEEINYNKDLESKVDEILNVVNTDWYNDNSDYCYNIKIVLSLEYIESKHWRLLLSYINSALNYLQDLQINNTYLGNINDRVEFTIKEVKALYSNGQYSYYSDENITYKIKTTNNQIIIWSTEKEPKANQTYKATIKSLKEYKDIKQTVVTRCRLVENKEPYDYTKTADYALNEFMKYIEEA